MNKGIAKYLRGFKSKFPMTIAWKLNRHAKVAEKYIDEDETLKYVFAGQDNNEWYNICMTCAVIITSKRIMCVKKRVLWGEDFNSITPDMFNDFTAKAGLIWGKVNIDTIKEVIILSNVDKKALPDIENNITNFVQEHKSEGKPKVRRSEL